MFGIKKLKFEIDSLKRENAELKKYHDDFHFFAEMGIKYAQSTVNGYRLSHWKHFHPDSALGLSFYLGARAFKETEGSTEKKLLAALSAMDRERPNPEFNKMLLKRLEKITWVSAHTGSLKRFVDLKRSAKAQ